MTIVCATHFSDSSFAAVKVAGQLARNHHEPLWLIDIVPPACGKESDAAISPALAREAAELSGQGIEVNTAALFGPLARAVRQFCSSKRAGLLVVGDSQQTLGPLIVGPLDRFADRISLPVLIVRDSKPFDAWASGACPLRVMLALDRTWRSAAAREWIARLAEYGAIDLVASYLWWPKDENERRAWASTPGEHPDYARSQRSWVEAEAAFSGLPSNVKRRVRLEAGRPHLGPQLLRLATAEHVDVVVLGTQPHRGPVGQQWSVSHEVLALAPMSVACIPEPVPLPSRMDLGQLNEAHLFDQVG